MSTYSFLVSVLVAICLVATGSVLVQHREVTDLRLQRQQLASRTNTPAPVPESSARPTPGSSEPQESAQLMELRNRITQLMQQQRELSDLRRENERLRAEIASHETNVSTAANLTGFPPGYIRRAQAQWVGLNTPKDTIQSFLWAMQHRDVTSLLRTLTPESAGRVQRQLQHANPPDALFNTPLPGMRIIGQTNLPDGSVELQVELAPGMPMPEPLHLHPIDGQWKMDLF